MQVSKTRVRMIAVFALLALVARAQTPVTYNWTNTAGGAFADANNWSPAGGPPTAWDLSSNTGGDIIEFNCGQTEPYEVTIAADDTFGIAYVRTDCVRFDLGGNTLNSGKISSGSVFVGSGLGNVGTLVVTNGTWSVTKDWQISHKNGIGLLINDGACLKNSADVNISNVGTGGIYMIRNGGTHPVNNSFKIGSAGGTESINGTLIITNAGSNAEVNGCYVKHKSRLYVAERALLTCKKSIAVYDTSVVTVDGTLKLYKAGYFGPMQANLDLDGGILEGYGACTNMSPTPFTTRNNGTIRPGGTNAAGSLAIGPTVYTQTVGKVIFEIGGTEPSQYDQLAFLSTTQMSSSVHLDPTGAECEVVLINGYWPDGGETFDLIKMGDYTKLDGAFQTLDLPDLGRSLGWETNSLYSSGSLSVVVIPPHGTVLMIR